ncbi:C4-dicarboxylate ABC transporter permease [Pseudoruegeria sp. SK021]|nr:C4-dicarboxylate ABC transporter permease [Pseudoruegeria sp. SK021]
MILEKLFLALNRWAVIGTLAAMSCIIFANVMLRYLTNNSIIWAEEVSRYLMIYMTFLGAGLALREGLLVAISQVHSRFAPKLRFMLRLTILTVLIVFFGWMILAGETYVTRMGRQLTPATRISFAYIYQAMPIGFGLLLIHTLLIARRFLTEGRFDANLPDAHGGVSGASG